MPKIKKLTIFLSLLAPWGLVILGIIWPLPNPASGQISESQIEQIPTILTGLRTRRDFLPIGVAFEKRDLHLARQAENGQMACDKDVDLNTMQQGVNTVATLENGICYNSDIDIYTRKDKTYVVQAGGYEAAWTHIDVSDPEKPMRVNQFAWDLRTYTPDIKAFRQGAVDYIAISMERSSTNGYCGIAIYDVTDPEQPILKSQTDGEDWCDVHNLFVEPDEAGDGAYIYITANATKDMRVLDISGNLGGTVSAPIEIGRYTVPEASYIHDVTVYNHVNHSNGQIGRRVYISYWEKGLVVLNAEDVTPGNNPTPLIGPEIIAPTGFLTHHAVATTDGHLVFIQDELLRASGVLPVQMWDINDPSNPIYVDGLELGTDVPANPAHNMEIHWDIEPHRLYVGWYQMGLQAWNFTRDGFARTHPAPRTASIYHQVQTEATDNMYDGAWGVRLAQIGGHTYIFQSDRRHGLIVNCRDCLNVPAETPTATSTITPEATITNTATETSESTFTPTPTATSSSTPNSTPSHTPTTTETPTDNFGVTSTPTFTSTYKETATASPTLISTVIPSATSTYMPTPSVTATRTPPPTVAASATSTATSIWTPTVTATAISVSTVTATATSVPTATHTSRPTETPTVPHTPTGTSTPVAVQTPTGTPFPTPSITDTPDAGSGQTATLPPEGQTQSIYLPLVEH